MIYVAGHNTFTYTWQITNGTTTTADYSGDGSGTVNITEQIGGSQPNGTFSLNYYDENRDINLSLTADGVDEPDTETFTIT